MQNLTPWRDLRHRHGRRKGRSDAELARHFIEQARP
jgi:hypothetical protein